jgi:ribosome-associated protein
MSDKYHLTILNKYQIPSHFLEKHFTHAHGHGGQNVNKLATKVQLKLIIDHSPLPQDIKDRLKEKFPAGHVEVACQETRHQHRNLEIAHRKLQEHINEALKEEKPRKKTKPFHKTFMGKLKKIKDAHKEKWMKRRYQRDE